MFYGKNFLNISCGEKISLTFNPFDALSECVEEIRVKDLASGKIDFIPQQIGVEGTEEWKHKDTTSIKDYKAIERKMDWSFSTPYKGSFSKGELQVGSGIPLEMLSPENPVLFYSEVLLFEDELADRGSAKCHVRFRIMNDCWFVLLRSYIRLDMVAVRILDTRIFHKFGESTILRDFTWKEETW